MVGGWWLVVSFSLNKPSGFVKPLFLLEGRPPNLPFACAFAILSSVLSISLAHLSTQITPSLRCIFPLLSSSSNIFLMVLGCAPAMILPSHFGSSSMGALLL